MAETTAGTTDGCRPRHPHHQVQQTWPVQVRVRSAPSERTDARALRTATQLQEAIGHGCQVEAVHPADGSEQITGQTGHTVVRTQHGTTGGGYRVGVAAERGREGERVERIGSQGFHRRERRDHYPCAATGVPTTSASASASATRPMPRTRPRPSDPGTDIAARPPAAPARSCGSGTLGRIRGVGEAAPATPVETAAAAAAIAMPVLWVTLLASPTASTRASESVTGTAIPTGVTRVPARPVHRSRGPGSRSRPPDATAGG